MSETLMNISPELILAGSENIPQNTVGFLETNMSFVNSYMVGLNHEMAKELLWRKYPTDQRGSYFRQFWNTSIAVERKRLELLAAKSMKSTDTLGSMEEENIIESHLDIEEIHKWDSNFHIDFDSKNKGVSSGSGTANDKIAFLIKGDLLRKYPDTSIYAAKAYVSDTSGNTSNGDYSLPDPTTKIRINGQMQQPETREPLFKGNMSPNITYLGFDLSLDDLTGKRLVDNKKDPLKPGWFIVIQQPPSAPAFGLDESDNTNPNHPINSWDDLNWMDVGISSSSYIQFGSFNNDKDKQRERPDLTNKKIGDITWNWNAADFAYITMQSPVKVAIHGELAKNTNS